METKIISQKKNPFLDREEILMEIKSNVAPSFEDVRKAIGKDENLTVVKKVEGNFGRHIFNAEIVLYNSTKSKDKIETIPKKIRKKIEAERKEKEAAEVKARVAKEAEEKSKEKTE